MSILVHRKSGLVEPFDVPELTIEASIDRLCVPGPGLLLVPREPEYLPTGATVHAGRYSFISYGWPRTFADALAGLPSV